MSKVKVEKKSISDDLIKVIVLLHYFFKKKKLLKKFPFNSHEYDP